jgi:hypothetical protein
MTSRQSAKPNDLQFAGGCPACGCSITSCETKGFIGGRRSCPSCSRYDHDDEAD